MANKELVQYALQSLRSGKSEEEVKASLMGGGWAEDEVGEAIFRAKPLASIPQPPRRNEKRIEKTRERVVEPALFSPYSVLLSLGLLFSLFVIGNQVFRDLARTEEVVSRLVAEAFALLPFIAIAFLLYAMLRGDKEKYKVLILPYLLVSGWLFVRLFTQVMVYIYDQAAAVGVYISLGMIIALLTVGVIFIQYRAKEKE